MTTGTAVALTIGGIAVVGGAAYLITRKPVTGGASSGPGRVPPQQAAGVGTAAMALGSGLGGLLTSLFGPSKNAPTTAILQSAPQLPQPAPQSWGGLPPATLAQDTSILKSQGYTGVDGQTQAEADLGIGPADYYGGGGSY